MNGVTAIETLVIGVGAVLMAIGFVLSHYHRMHVAAVGGFLVPAGAGIVFGVLIVGNL